MFLEIDIDVLQEQFDCSLSQVAERAFSQGKDLPESDTLNEEEEEEEGSSFGENGFTDITPDIGTRGILGGKDRLRGCPTQSTDSARIALVRTTISQSREGMKTRRREEMLRILGESKVRDFDGMMFVDQTVACGEIAMNDELLLEIVHRLKDLSSESIEFQLNVLRRGRSEKGLTMFS